MCGGSRNLRILAIVYFPGTTYIFTLLFAAAERTGRPDARWLTRRHLRQLFAIGKSLLRKIGARINARGVQATLDSRMYASVSGPME